MYRAGKLGILGIDMASSRLNVYDNINIAFNRRGKNLPSVVQKVFDFDDPVLTSIVYRTPFSDGP